MKRYAMAKEGTAFMLDSIDLSWPAGGVREVIEVDLEKQSLPFRQRVLNRVIVEVEDEANKVAVEETPYKLYEGEEARQVLEEPAAPVTVTKHGRSSKTSVEVTLVDPELTETPKPPPPVEGPRRAAGYKNTEGEMVVAKVTRRRAPKA
jgi:hypothetical protein